MKLMTGEIYEAPVVQNRLQGIYSAVGIENVYIPRLKRNSEIEIYQTQIGKHLESDVVILASLAKTQRF